MQDLIELDDRQRMVPADRPALVREVDRLLAEPATVRTRRQAGVGLVALGEYDRAVAVLTQALALAEQTGDDGGRIAARINLGDAWRYAGDQVRARPYYDEALALARVQRPDLVDFALQHLGKWFVDEAAYPSARDCLGQALALRRAKRDVALIRSTEQAIRLLPVRWRPAEAGAAEQDYGAQGPVPEPPSERAPRP